MADAAGSSVPGARSCRDGLGWRVRLPRGSWFLGAPLAGKGAAGCLSARACGERLRSPVHGTAKAPGSSAIAWVGGRLIPQQLSLA